MIRKGMNEAKEDWIQKQCTEVETSFSRNNSKRAFQVVKKLTQHVTAETVKSQHHSRQTYGEILTEEKQITDRWAEYCSELYNHQINGDPSVLTCQESANDDDHPILREEIEAGVRALKNGKAAGVDNIQTELIKHGGETVIDVLTKTCNEIWRTGEWPTPWTQSLIITLPKKGNLQLCQNYRTISLISHVSKVMLKVILNRLKPQAEDGIAEEQAGFRSGRSTT